MFERKFNLDVEARLFAHESVTDLHNTAKILRLNYNDNVFSQI